MKEYHKLKQKASKKTAGLSQQLMRLEQEKQTSEQSLEQVKMKKAELEQRQAQLKEQGCVQSPYNLSMHHFSVYKLKTTIN